MPKPSTKSSSPSYEASHSENGSESIRSPLKPDDDVDDSSSDDEEMILAQNAGWDEDDSSDDEDDEVRYREKSRAEKSGEEWRFSP